MAMSEITAPAADFWLASGFHLLSRDARLHLGVTDAYLRAYLQRPEIRPVAESCAAERKLNADLIASPRRAVPPAAIAAIKDADARDNYRVWLSLRDHLLAHGTLEAAYLALFRGGDVRLPRLFVDQMAHAILRNILDGGTSAFAARAAELLFRGQKVTIANGTVMLADEETVDNLAATGGFGALGRLIVEQGTRPRSIEIDVLIEANEAQYWARSDRFDMVLDVTFTRPGLDALCRVLEAWTAHFLGVAVAIHPVQAIRDEHWAWHVGLDETASAILNGLYEGREIDEAELSRVLSLFRLEFRDPSAMLPRIAGQPVYLAMAMTAKNELRLKPQNLLVNLPLARMS